MLVALQMICLNNFLYDLILALYKLVQTANIIENGAVQFIMAHLFKTLQGNDAEYDDL